MYKHVQQETDYDCGAAVTAMAIGCTLQEAKDQLTGTLIDKNIYYRVHQIAEVLAKHEIVLGLHLVPWGVVTKETKATIEFTLDLWPCILAVKSKKFKGKGHFVFWTGEVVFDPQEKEPTKLEDYEIEDIHPLTFFNDVEVD